MAWRRGINHQVLADLGSLTARLVRLVALRQIKQGQAQLASMGVRADIAKVYASFAKQEARKLQTPQEDVLHIVTTKESTF
jgi:hypothetical protein